MQPEAGLRVGGREESLQTATPALRALNGSIEAMSKDIVDLGPVGSGAKKVKLINSFSCGVGSKPRFPSNAPQEIVV